MATDLQPPRQDDAPANSNGQDQKLAEPAGADGTPPQQHQQVQPVKPRRRWWILFLMVALVGGVALSWRIVQARSDANAKASASATVPTVPVLAATAHTGDIPIYLTGLGVVTARNTVTIHARVDGYLDTVAFKQGQNVHAGDLLAQIDPRPFEVQLHQAEGQLAEDQAQLKNAELTMKRDQDAIEAIPRTQLDTATAAVGQFRGAVQVDQANIASAKLNLTYSRITSPITGRIGLRLVDPGNIVHATDTNGLAVITQFQPIDVIFTLPQDQIPQVQPRLKSGPVLNVEAYDRDLTKKLATGTLEALDSAIDTSSGTLRFRATFPNTDETLYPNQFVNARLLVNTIRNATLVPAAAVQRGPQSTFVYLIKPDSTVDLQNVTVGPAEGDTRSIATGLAPGEAVVTDGVDKLQPGTKVTVQHPPTTSPASRPSDLLRPAF
jgi:multidrug efflux system membrane fusion protein